MILNFSPDLFLDAINLISNSREVEHIKIIKELLALYDDSDNLHSSVQDDLTIFYVQLLKDLVATDIDVENDRDQLAILLKYENHSILMKYPNVLTTLESIFKSDKKLKEKRIDQLVEKLLISIKWNVASRYTKRIFAKLQNCSIISDSHRQKILIDEVLNSARSMVETISASNGVSIASKYLEKVDMSDKEAILKSIKHFKTRVKFVFKTGLHGLNRMFGKLGGFKLGESITINALKHQFKSGLLMSFAKWIITRNPPYIDPERPGIPTILFISLENEANENIMWWFERMYVDLHGCMYPASMSDEEIVEIVYECFNKSGYRLIIERKLGANFGYDEYVQLYEMYSRSGYRIIASIIDYMNMMKKGNNQNSSGRSDLALRELYTNMCNYNKNNGTTQISAHQLNRDAAKLVPGNTNVVKKFNDSHYADGMDVGREVDFELFIHIERNNDDVPYLTMSRGKHRYVNDTPEKDKYCAYMFHKVGIIDDIDGEDQSVKNIYANNLNKEQISRNVRKGHVDTHVDTEELTF